MSGGSAGPTQFLYDGDELVAEYDGVTGNMVQRYVHGAGVDDPLVWYVGSGLTQPRFLHTDHQGSITGIAGANGTLLAIDSYDEYGIPAAANLGRFQYTGQAWIAELKMYYYKARFYSPTLGRFMQADPIGYEDQVNLYAYVRNDPANSVDPTGQQAAKAPICQGCHTSSGETRKISTYPLDAEGAKQAGPAMACALAPVRCLGTLVDIATTALINSATNADEDEGDEDEPTNEITPDDLTGKTPEEIADLAGEMGLTEDSNRPGRYRDSEGRERIRIDRGHIDRKTGKPYNNPRAARDHVHGYRSDGTKVRDPNTNDPHFPLS